VLGVMRCDWGNVASITGLGSLVQFPLAALFFTLFSLLGIGVTPVVGYIKNFQSIESSLKPNPREMASLFTIPLSQLMDEKYWTKRDYSAPIFSSSSSSSDQDQDQVVWGLTGFLAYSFVQEILK